MKYYIKDNKIRKSNEIIILRDGMKTINPSESMILEDGWVEYEFPIIEPTLDDYKKQKKEEILSYDSSPNVNEFTINGFSVWLDKATRAGLMLRIQAEKNMGIELTTLWYEGNQFPLNTDDALQMLYAIEIYASACYDNTQRHLSEVDKLTTIEEVELYDYTTGYPNKLSI